MTRQRSLTTIAILTALLCACGGGGSGGSSAEIVQEDTPPAPPPAQSADTAATSCGTYQGTVTEDVVAFKGLPYAQPPSGALRWRAPTAPVCEDEVQLADTFAPACAQFDRVGGIASLEEDCLYLNVWTTAQGFPASERRPVLLFIHGGGNQTGSTSVEQLGVNLYDGAALAADTDAVVVTIAYRLGALGYLAHPALTAEDPNSRSGNYGLLDQLAALDWVQQNIATFGGDPQNVTLFGESAGGRNICNLVASPLASGLFTGAIMQSGGCRQQSLALAESDGVDTARAVGCESLTDTGCLRGASVESLLNAIGPELRDSAFVGINIGPNVDGYVLPGSPDDVIARGAHNQVPMIIGANTEETRLWIGDGITPEQYEGLVISQYGAFVGNQVLAAYPLSDYVDATAAYTALSTDAQFICPARRVAQSAALSSQPVYVYRFNKAFETPPLEQFGVFHGVELFYLFQKVSELESYSASPADIAVEDTLAALWGNFAATGEPSATLAEPWQAYSGASDTVLLIDQEPRNVPEPRAQQCNFWASLSGN